MDVYAVIVETLVEQGVLTRVTDAADAPIDLDLGRPT